MKRDKWTTDFNCEAFLYCKRGCLFYSEPIINFIKCFWVLESSTAHFHILKATSFHAHIVIKQKAGVQEKLLACKPSRLRRGWPKCTTIRCGYIFQNLRTPKYLQSSYYIIFVQNHNAEMVKIGVEPREQSPSTRAHHILATNDWIQRVIFRLLDSSSTKNVNSSISHELILNLQPAGYYKT